VAAVTFPQTHPSLAELLLAANPVPNVAIQFRAADLAFAEAMLEAIPNGARTAIRSAINDTLKRERTDMTALVADHLNLGPAEIRKRITITDRPTAYSLSGTLTVGYEGVPLEKFKPTVTKGAGASVTMLKDKGPETFKHAFGAKMPGSGHRGVFSRAKLGVFTKRTTVADLVRQGFPEHEAREAVRNANGLAGRGVRFQKRAAAGGNFPRVNARGVAWRLPIRTYRGVPVVAVFEHKPDLLDLVGVRTSDRFHERLLSKIDWILSRGNANFPGGSASTT
jgi:hypothetical protein